MMIKKYKSRNNILKEALEKKRGAYHISKDGYFSLDTNHPLIRKSLNDQINQLRKLDILNNNKNKGK